MDAKQAAQGTVKDNEERLIELSHRIHAKPETCFEEVSAAEWTAAALNDAGFSIETGVADLPTAYVATAAGTCGSSAA
jgi:metal-dependent amidase/aminoacylase/carboxypeptidase family protein